MWVMVVTVSTKNAYSLPMTAEVNETWRNFIQQDFMDAISCGMELYTGIYVQVCEEFYWQLH